MLRTLRTKGGVYGLLIGDAVGVPYEFHGPSDIPDFGKIDMTPPPGFRRSYTGVPVGTWSDDGAQALCVLRALIDSSSRETMDTDLLRTLMQNWLAHGYMAVGGVVFDVGITTSRALRLGQGIEDEGSQGNGSLMRCLPVGLFAPEPLVEEYAAAQSAVTHAHPMCMAACAVYARWARQLLDRDAENPLELLMSSFLLAHSALKETRPEVAQCVMALRVHGVSHPCRGTGWVVDAFWSAVHAVIDSSDYGSTIRRSIAYGNDTDTTAAIAGGIAGVIYGIGGIPHQWFAGLRQRETVEELLTKIGA